MLLQGESRGAGRRSKLIDAQEFASVVNHPIAVQASDRVVCENSADRNPKLSRARGGSEMLCAFKALQLQRFESRML